MVSKPDTKIIIKHEGVVQFETIGNLINLLKEKMKNIEVKIVIYKKILSVLIETLENIYKYSEYNKLTVGVNKDYLPLWE